MSSFYFMKRSLILIIVVVIIVLGFFIFLNDLTGFAVKKQSKTSFDDKLLKNAQGDYCYDGDLALGEEGQKYSQDFVYYLYNNCDDLRNLSFGECGFFAMASDVCFDSSSLLEQICIDNEQKTLEVNCLNGCLNGACRS